MGRFAISFEFGERLEASATFLAPYVPIFNREVILSYPASERAYPPAWAEMLQRLSPVERWRFDAQSDWTPLAGTDLGGLVAKLRQLGDCPAVEAPDDLPLPSWAFFRVGQKKRHEICKLAPLLSSLHQRHRVRELVDIGGGVGHLARVLAHYFAVPVLSVDKRPDLQRIGLGKLHHHPPPDEAQEVRFHCLNFDCQKALERGLFHARAGSVGLHTCGDLAMEHLRAFAASESPFALNFACCYHLCQAPLGWHSRRARRTVPFFLERVAFTLAARGHGHLSFEDYQLKERVKFFRYTLHFFLREHWGLREFVPVGSAHRRLYGGEFEDYALAKLKGLAQRPCHRQNALPSARVLRQYFADEKRQKKIRTLFFCNLVRWQFGRALESLILLDRCLWAAERGYRVALKRFFRPEISPRNLGILVEKGH